MGSTKLPFRLHIDVEPQYQANNNRAKAVLEAGTKMDTVFFFFSFFFFFLGGGGARGHFLNFNGILTGNETVKR